VCGQASQGEPDTKEDQQQEKARRHSVPWHKKLSFKKMRISQVKAPSRELLEVESPVMDAPPPTPEDLPVDDCTEVVEEEAVVASTPDSPEPPEAPSTPPVAPPRTKRRSEAQRPQTLALEADATLTRKTSLPAAPAHVKVVNLRRNEDEGGWEKMFKKLSKRSGMFPFAFEKLITLSWCWASVVAFAPPTNWLWVFILFYVPFSFISLSLRIFVFLISHHHHCARGPCWPAAKSRSDSNCVCWSGSSRAWLHPPLGETAFAFFA
jgi:hypothetical protein